jgi:hypothetical protein
VDHLDSADNFAIATRQYRAPEIRRSVPKLDKAIGLSFINTFGVLGFQRLLPDATRELSDLLLVVAGVQMMAGVILLFLFGLALRNRFRMR